MDEIRKEKNQIKSGAIITYLTNACNILISVLMTPIILKLIGDQEYGLYSLIYSMMAYFSVLDFGFGNAMIRYISKFKAENKDDKNINSLFLIIYIFIGIIALVLGSVIYFNLNNIFGESLSSQELEKINIMMIIFLINVALSFPLSVFDSYVMANEKFVFLKFINLLKVILYPLAILPLLILGFKSITMVIVFTSLNLLSHVCYAIYSLTKLKMKITLNIKEIDFSIFKEIICYSFFVFLTLIVDTVFNNTDQVILGVVSGTTAVSIYTVANQIKNANNNFSTAISGLFLPNITKLFAKNETEKISDTFIKISKIQLYIMLLILSGFFIFGKNFINLWVGKGYKDVYYIVLLLIGFGIVPMTQNVGISVIQAMNKHRFRSVVYCFIAVLNIGVSIPLAKVYGGIGTAIGTALANILGQILIMNIYYYKIAHLDIPLYWKNFIKLCLPVFIFSVFFKICIDKVNFGWINLFATIIIYIAIYFIYLWKVHFNKEEKDFILKIISKIRR
ncbi:MAG: lipopolysaccharide biosynthesis protein [Candidatus Scatovivens sp.]